MDTTPTRREFLADVSRATVVAAVGSSLASELGIAPVFAADVPDTLDFGPLEPLVRLMQETPANKLRKQWRRRWTKGSRPLPWANPFRSQRTNSSSVTTAARRAKK